MSADVVYEVSLSVVGAVGPVRNCGIPEGFPGRELGWAVSTGSIARGAVR